MKALLSIEPGPPSTLVLSDVPEPVLRDGTLLVRVEACGLNFPDLLMIEDKYQAKPPRPFSPGEEVAGTIEAIGSGVEGWNIGDRIVAVLGYGGLAERIVVDSTRVYRLPPGCSPEMGAALLVTYASAFHALTDRGRLREGDKLLVLGAGGGVGLAGVELGKILGATVIAAVSSPRKAEAALAAGADKTVIYPRGPVDRDGRKELAVLFKDAVGNDGADVVFDPVGGDYADAALRAIAWGGRYLVIGFPAGIPQIPLNLPLLKSCDICGVFWGAFALRDPERSRQEVNQLLEWLAAGRITPHIAKIWNLENAGDALASLAAREIIGKAVVTLR